MIDESKLEVGQVLWLNVKYQKNVESKVEHPMLICRVEKKTIEVIALDKTAGKLHQLFHKYNYFINSLNPKESVIFEDSYAQLNTKLTIELTEELIKARKTVNKLSQDKLQDLIETYNDYQKYNKIDADRVVHMSSTEILKLNPNLKQDKVLS